MLFHRCCHDVRDCKGNIFLCIMLYKSGKIVFFPHPSPQDSVGRQDFFKCFSLPSVSCCLIRATLLLYPATILSVSVSHFPFSHLLAAKAHLFTLDIRHLQFGEKTEKKFYIIYIINSIKLYYPLSMKTWCFGNKKPKCLMSKVNKLPLQDRWACRGFSAL